MALIREQLDALDPDVIGLQEVLQLETKSGTQNQVTDFCGDRHWVYGPAHDMTMKWVPKGTNLRFGNAVASKYPIRSSTVHPLFGADVSDQQRSLLHCVIEAPFGDLDFFVTHLNWRLDESWIRERQVVEIARIVHRDAKATFPAVLVGDFNAEPDADEIRYLLGKTRLDQTRNVRFADAWQYGDGSPGYTFDAQRNHFAAIYPEHPRRLDYIFVRGPNAKGQGRPMNPRLGFHKDVNEVWCSDHFGVVTELRVQP